MEVRTDRTPTRRTLRGSAKISGAILVACVPLIAGCLVPQPPGKGRLLHKIEPETHRGYYLYLPEDYVRSKDLAAQKRWPVVVTFHGMKPFDNASAQVHEWQYEADNYGLIVVAPELLTSDLFMEFPLRHVQPYLKADERAVVAILKEVFRTTNADPTRVLATSWSSGGYVAHYMVNRHPRLFSCLAPRQSNFSPSILDAAKVPAYRDTPVGIFFGENDFAVCRKESTEAVKWYRQHGFKTVEARVVVGLGHERTPQTAAAFFAKNSQPSIRPIRPALAQASLARLDFRPATFAGIKTAPKPLRPPAREPVARLASAADVRTPAGDYRPGTKPRARRPQPPKRTPLAKRPAARPKPKPPKPPLALRPVNPVRVAISTKMGIAPLHVSFAAEMPSEIAKGASCLWTDNGEPICNGLSGHKILAKPGEHSIGLLVITRNGRQYRAWTRVKVLPRTASRQ